MHMKKGMSFIGLQLSQILRTPSTSQQISDNTIQGLHRLCLGDKDSQGQEGEPEVEIAFSPRGCAAGLRKAETSHIEPYIDKAGRQHNSHSGCRSWTCWKSQEEVGCTGKAVCKYRHLSLLSGSEGMAGIWERLLTKAWSDSSFGSRSLGAFRWI